MKARRIFLVLVCVFTAVLAVACGHEHAFDSYEISVAPTLEAAGKATASCECGETSEVELPALSDSTVWSVKATVNPTCTEKGSKTYTSIYGDVVIEISATGHTVSSYTITTEPTETVKGAATATCSCGNTETVEVPVLTDSAWTVKSTTDATCTENGSKVYTSIYGDVTVTLTATDHTWGEWTEVTAPTKDAEGLIIKSCANDATHVERFTLPALNDEDYTLTVEAAKCGVDGKEVYSITKDGKTFTYEVAIDALVHQYGAWEVTTKPTATTAGVISKVCSHDATHVETFEIPALNDTDYEYAVVEADCGVDGKETYTFTKDGQTIVIEVVLDALTHTFGDWTVTTAPTTTTAGLLTKVCSNDETHTETFELPALNKTDYTCVSDEPECGEAGKETYTYTKDGQEFVFEVVLTALTHAYGDWVLTTGATVEEAGLLTRTCTHDATHTETFVLPALNKVDYTYSVKAPVCGESDGLETYVYTKDGQEFTFTIVVPKADHLHDEYEMTTEPTETETGKANAACDCGDVIEVEVPVLTDSTVWVLVSSEEADYNKAGVREYTSVYGDVTFVVAKLVAPYDGKTYTSINFEAAPEGLFKNGVVRAETTWSNASISFDENGVGCGTAYPFRGYFVIEMVDATTGEILITKYDAIDTDEDGNLDSIDPEGEVVANKGYVDFETGYIMAEEGHYAEYNLWIPAVDSTVANEVINNAFTTFTYITNNENYPDPKYYTNGGLKMNYENMGVLSNVFAAQSKVKVILNIAAINENEKTAAASEDVFTIYALNANGEVVDTKTLSTITADSNNVVELAGEGIVQVKVIMTGYYNNGTKYCNLNLKGVTVVGLSDVAGASSWDNALAINYTDKNFNEFNVFVYNGVVYFGVEFTDGEEEVAANECFAADLVYVIDSEGEVIEAFANNGTKLVVADGFQGTYTGEFQETAFDLVVSGAGFARVVIENDFADATYVVAQEGSEYTIGLYMMGQYYEVTLVAEDMTCTLVYPEVVVTFVVNESETRTENANINVAYDLPVLENTETHTFKGWFYDAECTQEVEAEFIPTTAITLYASWKAKVVVTLVDVAEDDQTTLYLGEGDVIGDYLPVYTETINNRKFEGWYLDAEFQVSLPEEAAITSKDTGIVIYAKWSTIAPYVGTYLGTEIWNASYGNSGGKTLIIDENGNMSGYKTGVIISYNPETQVVEWKTSLEGTAVYKFYYNATLDIIAGLYDNYNIGNDYIILSKHDEDGKANDNYGIKVAKSPTDSTRGWYAQFVNITTALGDVEVFLYNNYIYDTFTATDALGNVLTSSTVEDAKTLIVKDAEGNIIVSVASTGASFYYDSNTVDLDQYFGTYTNGEEEVVLDGVGNIVYGELSGTYTVAPEGSEHQLDVYFNNNTEYYALTLDGTTFTLVKVMVAITYEEGEYAEVEDIQANKNVPFTLPVLEHETNVFNGWFYDDEFTQPVGAEFVPTVDVTLYALWKVKVTLTVNANNGTEAQEVVYSEGDTVEIENPTLKGQKFAGWYTSESFIEGTEWTNGSVITTDTSIYAKWEAAPAYYNSYTVTRIQKSSKVTAVSDYYCYTYYSSGSYATSKFVIDADGKGTSDSNPFRNGFVVENYNVTTGYLELVDASNSSSRYKGYLDPVTGIIITIYQTSKNNFNEVFFYNPISDEELTRTNLLTSYWHEGQFRAIEYVHEETSYTAFVMNDQVYFGVSFEDAEGNAVAGNECYTQAQLFVKDRNGELLAKFAMGEAQLELMDGNEGTYVNGENTLVIDGVKTATLNGVSGTYAAATEGSSYGFDVYVDGSYYEVSLNKEEGTYTINKPMVTVTYETSGLAEVPAVSTNKNIAITLPTPTNEENVFKGWFRDAECTEAVGETFTPTENVTLYALWKAKVTLTVVYGNGLEEVVLDYVAGETTAPEKPAYTNGQAFDGWYLDAEFNTPYTEGVIEEDTTIYCKWIEKGPYTVEDTSSSASYAFNYDAETRVWTSGNKGMNSSQSSFKITALGEITVTFQYFCSSENESKWDFLSIKKNGVTQYTAGGKVDTITYSDTITITLAAGDTLEFVYVKDGSSAGGFDAAYIKDLAIDGALVTKLD